MSAVVHDVVGAGFGPANLALAIALDELPAEVRPRAVFLERKAAFGWHPGLLLPEATMQVSFLKDLVTLRNPASRFSFLSYLHARDRLADFVNLGAHFPTRVEFHDYLGWVEAEFRDRVVYDTELVDVRPVPDGDVVRYWDVVTRAGSGRELVRRTRNLVLATGITPFLPAFAPRSPRVWHSAEFLHRLVDLPDRAGLRFAVVGAGQSAAEIAAHLHQRFPDSQVHAVMSRYGYSRADDSAFTNRVFDPAAVDDFFQAPPEVRRRFHDYHANTNYSVVDDDLITELFRRHYDEKVRGRQRLHLVNLAEVTGMRAEGSGVRVGIRALGTGEQRELSVDVVVCATGYRPMDPVRLLGSAAGHVELDEQGLAAVERDHRVVTAPGVHAGVYLQGGTEHTHGLSSSLLSNVAVRAGEIAAALAARRSRPLPVRPSEPAGAPPAVR